MTSASAMKGGHQSKLTKDKPRDGTRLREIYDLFMSNKGKVLDYEESCKGITFRQREDLIDFYGLDIRVLKNKQWILVGEWVDRGGYIDYVNVGDI